MEGTIRRFIGCDGRNFVLQRDKEVLALGRCKNLMTPYWPNRCGFSSTVIPHCFIMF